MDKSLQNKICDDCIYKFNDKDKVLCWKKNDTTQVTDSCIDYNPYEKVETSINSKACNSKKVIINTLIFFISPLIINFISLFVDDTNLGYRILIIFFFVFVYYKFFNGSKVAKKLINIGMAFNIIINVFILGSLKNPDANIPLILTTIIYLVTDFVVIYLINFDKDFKSLLQ